MNIKWNLECYDCGFVGLFEDYQESEPPDLVDIIDNVQKRTAFHCPECGGQQLGPLS